MAYPFLPVNPCCTEVVLNSPCGCSSTITNGGCNDNPCGTHLTASSTIVYNGPALSCTTAEPCDTLNVILQKIDEIICNLLTQINILTIQINNITTQIINIEGDIINIYNQLGECCTTTTSTSSSSTSTTTSTTTIHPCENFSLTNTGVDPVAIIITDCTTQEQSAIVLLPGDTNICVVTDSPLTVPGTIIVVPNGPCTPPTSSTTSTTSTSTSSTSSTTTTSTTAIPCECLTFENTDDSDHIISYIDCGGEFVGTNIFAQQTLQFCGCCGASDSELVFITIGADCIGGLCPGISTTTTTSSSSSSSTTTTTTTAAPNCEFTGTATQLPDVTTTTTTTTACTRPERLVTVEYFNTYTYNDTIVDYTSSLLDACAACNFIKDNIFDIQQETSLFGQSGSFNIGQYVYAGTGTSCNALADGFYITDHETCQIAEILDGYIVNISNCELTPTTTTTTTTINPSCSNFELQGLTGGGSWTGLDCYTELFVGDSVPQGFSEFTGCIISSSLEVTNLENKGEIPCSTTTTTTTLLSACYIVEGIWEVDDPAHPAGGYIDYIDEFGNNQSLSGLWVIDSINIIASSLITSSGVTITPC